MKFRYPTEILWVDDGWWLFDAADFADAQAKLAARYPTRILAAEVPCLQVLADRWHFADRYFDCQCDPCGAMVPEHHLRTVWVHGTETSACWKCRGDEDPEA